VSGQGRGQPRAGPAGRATDVAGRGKFAVALVLDHAVAGAAAREKLAEIAAWLFDHGARHLTLVGTGEIAPSLWESRAQARLAQTGTHSLGAAGEARHFHGDEAGIAVLPPRSGRAGIIAAIAELARTETAALEGALKAAIERLSGPAPDLILFCGELQRLDDAFSWGAAYAELIFLAAPWSALSCEDLGRAVEEFAGRERRFGALSAT
jgi:undecaprenyl pyrophosphate synthase